MSDEPVKSPKSPHRRKDSEKAEEKEEKKTPTKKKKKDKHKKEKEEDVEKTGKEAAENQQDEEPTSSSPSSPGSGLRKAKIAVPPLSPKKRVEVDEGDSDDRKGKEKEKEEEKEGDGETTTTTTTTKKKKANGEPKIRQRAHTIATQPSKTKGGKAKSGSAGSLSPDLNQNRRDVNANDDDISKVRARGGSMIIRGSKKEMRRDKTGSLVLDKEASIERVLMLAKEKKTHKPTAESLFFHDEEDEAYHIFSPRPDVRTLLNDSHLLSEDEDKPKKNKKPSLFKRLIMKKE